VKSPSCHVGASAAMSSGDDKGFLSCLLGEVLCVGKGFGFNHKIMINVQELSPSIKVTRNIWSARV